MKFKIVLVVIILAVVFVKLFVWTEEEIKVIEIPIITPVIKEAPKVIVPDPRQFQSDKPMKG